MLRRPFRLQTLLRVREIEEERRAQELADTRRSISAASKERQFIEQEQVRILAEAAQASKKVFRAADVRGYYSYERHLAQRAVEIDSQLAALQTQEEERRRELEEASKSKRIVERLKDKHREALRNDVNRMEQKISDEVSSSHAAGARGER